MADTAGSVLVVDDSGGLRSLYALWLGERYDVRAAADGVAALDRIDREIDVVVLDREMPRKDGPAVARALDGGEFDPAVVMVSGVVPGAGLLDLPVDDYLQKPVGRAEVLDAVGRAMALAERPAPVRERGALHRRLEVVRASTDAAELADSDPYRRAVAALGGESGAPGDGSDPAPVATTDRSAASQRR